jgi:kanamycin kinase
MSTSQSHSRTTRPPSGTSGPPSEKNSPLSEDDEPSGPGPEELAGTPQLPVTPPPVIVSMAHGSQVTAVWENELGGVTFRLDPPPHNDARSRSANARFVKWAPAEAALDMEAEAARLEWARPYTPVPEVVGVSRNATEQWLETKAIEAENAVSSRWIANPAPAVRAIGVGLRAMHDALPVEDCPFSWSVGERLSRSSRENGRLLADAPPIDRLVVCHGDACAPNTLVDAAGDWVAHVDLGALGVGDRWADLAIATWSTVWNYGPGWEELLLEAYGIDPDPERMRYYRALWDAT